MTTIEQLNLFDYEAKALSKIETPVIIDIKPRMRNMSNAIKQLDSGQDSVFTGSYSAPDPKESFDWAIISDGHGKTFSYKDGKRVPYMIFNQAFEALDHLEIALSDDPVAYIQKMIPPTLYPPNIGATFLMLKVFQNRAEIFSIGDSSARVYINKTLVYKNELHKITSDKEIVRLAKQNIPYEINKGDAPRILDGNHLIMESSDTVTFYKGDTEYGLSLTQSIGHHGMTGFEPERKTIEFGDEDEVQIIIGSDGLFDIVCDKIDGPFLADVEHANNLIEFAEKRWLQKWILCITPVSRDSYMKYKSYREEMSGLKLVDMPDGNSYYEYEETGFPLLDDISCVVWSQR